MNKRSKPASARFAGSMGSVVVTTTLMVCFAWPGAADDGMVTISVVNKGSSVTQFLVRDENCVRPEREKCEAARLKVASGNCVSDPAAHRCLDALALEESTVCRSDILYDGFIPQGQSIKVKACVSAGGYASISVRGRNLNTVWHRYLMLNDGDAVQYP